MSGVGHQKPERTEGWLTKRAVRSKRNWKKRYFVLDGGDLSYYADLAKKKKKGHMLLTDKCRVECDPITPSRRTNIVEISWANGTSLLLSAANMDEQAMWRRAFEAAIEHMAASRAGALQEDGIPFGLTTVNGRVVSGGGSRPFVEAETGGGFEWQHLSHAPRSSEYHEIQKVKREAARHEARRLVQLKAKERKQQEREEKEWRHVRVIKDTSERIGNTPKRSSVIHMTEKFKGQDPHRTGMGETRDAHSLHSASLIGASSLAIDEEDSDGIDSEEEAAAEDLNNLSAEDLEVIQQREQRRHMKAASKHKVVIEGWMHHDLRASSSSDSSSTRRLIDGHSHTNHSHGHLGGFFGAIGHHSKHWVRRFAVLQGFQVRMYSDAQKRDKHLKHTIDLLDGIYAVEVRSQEQHEQSEMLVRISNEQRVKNGGGSSGAGAAGAMMGEGEDVVPSLGRDESDASVDRTRSTLTLHSTMPTPHGKLLTPERQVPDLLVLLRRDGHAAEVLRAATQTDANHWVLLVRHILSFKRTMSRVPLLKSMKLSKQQLHRMAEEVQMLDFMDGEKVITQGGKINEESLFYIVVSGRARVEVDGRQVAYRGVDEFFGEMGLIDNTPRNADVIADGHLRTLGLSRAAFRRCRKRHSVDAKIQNKVERIGGHVGGGGAAGSASADASKGAGGRWALGAALLSRLRQWHWQRQGAAAVAVLVAVLAVLAYAVRAAQAAAGFLARVVLEWAVVLLLLLLLCGLMLRLGKAAGAGKYVRRLLPQSALKALGLAPGASSSSGGIGGGGSSSSSTTSSGASSSRSSGEGDGSSTGSGDGGGGARGSSNNSSNSSGSSSNGVDNGGSGTRIASGRPIELTAAPSAADTSSSAVFTVPKVALPPAIRP